MSFLGGAFSSNEARDEVFPLEGESQTVSQNKTEERIDSLAEKINQNERVIESLTQLSLKKDVTEEEVDNFLRILAQSGVIKKSEVEKLLASSDNETE